MAAVTLVSELYIFKFFISTNRQPLKRTSSSTDDISTSKRRKLCHSQYNITINDNNEWVEESNNSVAKVTIVSSYL